MNRYTLSIGSNSPDKDTRMQATITWLQSSFEQVRCSEITSSRPISGIGADYLNLVAEVSSALSPSELRDTAKAYERSQGRTPESKLHGSVPIDIDIVCCNDEIIRPEEYRRDYFIRALKTLVISILCLCSGFTASAQWTCAPPDAVMPHWQSRVPQIVHPDSQLVQLYERTWQTAASRVRRGPDGIVASPYLDENCYDDQIWIWDGCFMVLFSKYAPDAFPGKETLMNYYAPIHDGAPSPLRIHLRDNPPLFAWAELQNFRHTADTAHIANILLNHRYLQRHFSYFNSLRKGDRNPALSPNPIFLSPTLSADSTIIGYGWNGNASGMDNTPRGRDRGGWDKILWIDAISQQALAAESIASLLSMLGREQESRTYQAEYRQLRDTINRLYWDQTDGFYYDIDATNHEHSRVRTLASFWAMMAGIPDSTQARRMASTLLADSIFGGPRPWNSLSRSDADFDSSTGDYWRGGIWLPMAYMGTKALERYGLYALADTLATRVVDLQKRTYFAVEPHTIWETYSPVADLPSTEHGQRVRQEFCGWSALGPISLTIENILGFRHADGLNRVLTWDLNTANGLHGIRHLRFGSIDASLIYYPISQEIIATANHPFTLRLNGHDIPIPQGLTCLPTSETN